MRVNISGLHRLGVFSVSFIHNVTSWLKVRRNKVTTGSIGVVRLGKSCHKLQLYQFALSRWVSGICGLSNRPDHAVRLKMLLELSHQDDFNPLPHMPILGSSNSAANKDMVSKILTDGETVITLSRKHCGKRKNCLSRAIFPFPTMFLKAVCC